MAVDSLTDVQIADLLHCAKHVENPGGRSRTDGKHVRRDYKVRSTDGRHEFVLFTRQSTVIAESFSVGLRWKSKTGEEVILVRCNGADHTHGNAIEREQFGAQYHVHIATERYIVSGRKAESFAQSATEYRTLEGALHHLTRLASIAGLNTRPDEADLFEIP
ncbi:MAG: hypothetical protein U1A72_13260 [Sulfuritalea sp.]|nr:hypothetical protein [Sulfuritalea sp.]